MSLFLAKETREGPFGAHSGFRSGSLVGRGPRTSKGWAMASLATPLTPGDLPLVGMGIARMSLATATLCIVLIDDAMSPR